MMKSRIYKEVYFEASHRLLHYEGKCNRLHGHQWRVEVWMEGEIGEKSCILVDFNCIKEVIQHFDHQTILNSEDPMVACLSQFQELITTAGDPTSELLAAIIAEMITEECVQSAIDARVVKIRVWESTSCYAECSYENQ
jgi:6-pyruvoyltetrahydropterin/6-carboxytetrahydropterin synthase